MPEAAITVNGRSYGGWTSVSVTRAMEALAPSFELEYHDQWSQDGEAIPIIEGMACVVQLNDQDVINGYVDQANMSDNARGTTMTVRGRATTGDLVDCAAIYALGKGQWINQGLARIATDLCQPFGITVSVQTDLGDTFRKFALQDSETVDEALERACRMRGVLKLTDGSGQLVLTRASQVRTRSVIRRGDNVVEASRAGSWSERYSQYIVKSQVSGDDNLFGETASAIKRTSEDPDVVRYRPLIVQAEGQESGTMLQKRADFERNVRAGRSQRLTYVVHGWENEEGLWAPNVLVRVIDPKYKVDRELLIVSVQQNKGADGTSTTLEVCDPLALSVEPLVPKPDRSLAWLGE